MNIVDEYSYSIRAQQIMESCNPTYKVHGKDRYHQPKALKHSICDSKHSFCQSVDSKHPILRHLLRRSKYFRICAWRTMFGQQCNLKMLLTWPGGPLFNFGEVETTFESKDYWQSTDPWKIGALTDCRHVYCGRVLLWWDGTPRLPYKRVKVFDTMSNISVDRNWAQSDGHLK